MHEMVARLQAVAMTAMLLTRLARSAISATSVKIVKIGNWMRGDYGNLTLVLDLTLSRIDSSLFTGTRWEGDLTELDVLEGPLRGRTPLGSHRVGRQEPAQPFGRARLPHEGEGLRDDKGEILAELDRADVALYRAKHGGRDCTVIDAGP